MKRLNMLITSLVIIFIFLCDISIAQEYKIGPEDVLAITFWQQPQLNTNVRVSQSGDIVLPVIGNITAAGLTPTQLSAKIVDKISVFNRNISQASVVVNQYGSKKIYVTGHVMNPGKYTFEVIPDLWKIILEAGGPAETAILNQVKVIRGGTEAGKIITVDLTEFLGEGDLSKLPSIYPGDTIKILGLAGPVEGAAPLPTGGVTEAQVEEDVIYIYGQVARPGGYRFTRNMDLLEAIIIAGGPAQTAKLEEVKVITRGNPYSSVATIDLKKYAKLGTPAPFLLNPGDTVYIPQKSQSVFLLLRQGNIIYDMARIILSATITYFIYRVAFLDGFENY